MRWILLILAGIIATITLAILIPIAYTLYAVLESIWLFNLRVWLLFPDMYNHYTFGKEKYDIFPVFVKYDKSEEHKRLYYRTIFHYIWGIKQ